MDQPLTRGGSAADPPRASPQRKTPCPLSRSCYPSKEPQRRKGAREVWKFGGLEVWRFGGLEAWGDLTAKTPGCAGGLRAEGEAWKFGGLEAWGEPQRREVAREACGLRRSLCGLRPLTAPYRPRLPIPLRVPLCLPSCPWWSPPRRPSSPARAMPALPFVSVVFFVIVSPAVLRVSHKAKKSACRGGRHLLFYAAFSRHGGLAQSVEQRNHNPRVGGSIPSPATIEGKQPRSEVAQW